RTSTGGASQARGRIFIGLPCSVGLAALARTLSTGSVLFSCAPAASGDGHDACKHEDADRSGQDPSDSRLWLFHGFHPRLGRGALSDWRGRYAFHGFLGGNPVTFRVHAVSCAPNSVREIHAVGVAETEGIPGQLVDADLREYCRVVEIEF